MAQYLVQLKKKSKVTTLAEQNAAESSNPHSVYLKKQNAAQAKLQLKKSQALEAAAYHPVFGVGMAAAGLGNQMVQTGKSLSQGLVSRLQAKVKKKKTK